MKISTATMSFSKAWRYADLYSYVPECLILTNLFLPNIIFYLHITINHYNLQFIRVILSNTTMSGVFAYSRPEKTYGHWIRALYGTVWVKFKKIFMQYVSIDETGIFHYIPESNRSSFEWMKAGLIKSNQKSIRKLESLWPL